MTGTLNLGQDNSDVFVDRVFFPNAIQPLDLTTHGGNDYVSIANRGDLDPKYSSFHGDFIKGDHASNINWSWKAGEGDDRLFYQAGGQSNPLNNTISFDGQGGNDTFSIEDTFVSLADERDTVRSRFSDFSYVSGNAQDLTIRDKRNHNTIHLQNVENIQAEGQTISTGEFIDRMKHQDAATPPPAPPPKKPVQTPPAATTPPAASTPPPAQADTPPAPQPAAPTRGSSPRISGGGSESDGPNWHSVSRKAK